MNSVEVNDKKIIIGCFGCAILIFLFVVGFVFWVYWGIRTGDIQIGDPVEDPCKTVVCQNY